MQTKEKRTNVKQRRLAGWRRLLAVALLPLALLVVFTVSPLHPGVAHAQNPPCPGCSVVVGTSGQLIARTTVLISATVICVVPPGFTLLQGSMVEVGITQVSRNKI